LRGADGENARTCSLSATSDDDDRRRSVLRLSEALGTQRLLAHLDSDKYG
jgi:hypothetical protein